MKNFILAFLLLCSYATLAQQHKHTYHKSNGTEVNVPDSAEYHRIITPDSASGLFAIKEYYLNNKLRFTGYITKPNVLLFQGECITYFKNGKTKILAQYDKNTTIGPVSLYYPNGRIYAVIEYAPASELLPANDFTGKAYYVNSNYDSLGKATVIEGNGHYIGYDDDFKYVTEDGNVVKGKRNGIWNANADSGKTQLLETYDNGRLLSGTATYEDGSFSTYTVSRMALPQFYGGIEGFYKYLSNTLRYPEADRKKGIEGRVYIKFVVEKDGRLADLQVTRSVSPGTDAEAKRALIKCPKWLPAMRFGKKVRLEYTVPIVFALK
jgi:TonB family protein